MAEQPSLQVGSKRRALDARPDTLDFRDKMYVPTLAEVPVRWELEDYRKWNVPILDQGVEGACTGFGLATVANYLLLARQHFPDPVPVSARMFYEMAKRYDEWAGEDYSGASARGAMKGWHKHGVCRDELWPYRANQSGGTLTPERSRDAAARPLGAYFRVNHKDLVAMHSALSEVGVLYATAMVHEGWGRVGRDGTIPQSSAIRGGHAFAIVAYDERGLWIQNSWGGDWGRGGFARLTYDDWLTNGTDVWVARLGAPIQLRTYEGAAAINADHATAAVAYRFEDLRPHIVSIANNGLLCESGMYATTDKSLKMLLQRDFPRVTQNWRKKRLLLYAHGGLTDEGSAIQRVADYRKPLLDAEIYPLAFIWKTDFWTTTCNILRDALRRRRTGGWLDETKDFMLDRIDDALEPAARYLGGKAQWDEMKENALGATQAARGGARKTAKLLAGLLRGEADVELHLAGHSAGAVFHAPLAQLLATRGKIKTGPLKGVAGLGLTIASCTLWAPACTVRLFEETYLPVLRSGGIQRFALYTLTDQVERDDNCADIYHKSLLYLVSNAFEREPRIPLARGGVPILGMDKFLRENKELLKLPRGKNVDWVLAPNTAPFGSPQHSTARHHGDFDDDPATLRGLLARILNVPDSQAPMTLHHSADSIRRQRQKLQAPPAGEALSAR